MRCCKIIALLSQLTNPKTYEWPVRELNVGAQKEPIRSGFGKRHADAAGIYHASFSDPTIKLHVGVSADSHWRVDSSKDRQQGGFRGHMREHLSVVARCSVAEGRLAWIS
jgi:hypothetical protein